MSQSGLSLNAPHSNDGSSSVEVLAEVAQALAGAERAFERLFASVEQDVRALATAALRGRSDVDVADVVQDVRIYVHQKLAVYDPAYPFVVFVRGLARTIVRRHCARPREVVDSLGDRDTDNEASWKDRIEAPEMLRASVGEERFYHAGSGPSVSPLFTTLIELFLSEGGYPHQQVAFGYSVLLWGRPKKATHSAARYRKVDVTGDPGRVVEELGPRALRCSFHEMLAELSATTRLPLDFLRRCAHAVDMRLGFKCADVFLGDHVSTRVFGALLQRTVGTTRLEDYFGKDPRKSVADWTRTVKLRLQRAVLPRNLR